MKSQYDVVVVGAGPAGSMAALQAAKAGLDVLLLEKKQNVGNPVHCAEGVPQAGFHSFFAPDQRWIASIINGITLVAPNGLSVTLNENQKGYILNRMVFDADLATMANDEGATVKTDAYVSGLIKEGTHVTGVYYSNNGEPRPIQAKVVIGADGIESRVGRWAGIDTSLAMKDVESCAQVTLSGITVKEQQAMMFFGREVAPGGYAWVFPKGKNRANVGLGIAGIYSKYRLAYSYLQNFIDNHFPAGIVEAKIAGGVPCAPTLSRIITDGLMLVGDAAHQVNPLTGGGIIRAIQAGDIAGRVAARAIKKGDVSIHGLEKYPIEWNELRGKTHAYCYRLKEVVFALTDEKFNHIAQTLNKTPHSEVSLYKIFSVALLNHPVLLADMVKAVAWGSQ